MDPSIGVGLILPRDFKSSGLEALLQVEYRQYGISGQYRDTDLVQGKIRAVPGGEVRLSMDAVAVVLGFGPSILPLQVVWVAVNAAEGKPRERLRGVLMLASNLTIIIRMRGYPCQILHSLRAWMYRDHCLSFLIRSAILRRGGITGTIPTGQGSGRLAPSTVMWAMLSTRSEQKDRFLALRRPGFAPFLYSRLSAKVGRRRPEKDVQLMSGTLTW